MTAVPKVLWTVQRSHHEYRADLLILGDNVELRIIRDGSLMFAERWPSEQAAIEESEAYRALLVDVL
jgi:hypothetical protein